MNDELLRLVDDESVPYELQARLIITGLKMKNAKTITEVKDALKEFIAIIEDIEKVLDEQ